MWLQKVPVEGQDFSLHDIIAITILTIIRVYLKGCYAIGYLTSYSVQAVTGIPVVVMPSTITLIVEELSELK